MPADPFPTMQFFKPNPIFWTVIGLLLTTSTLSLKAASSSSDAYQKGNALYEDEKYANAIRVYLKNIENGKLSEEIFYNLGNAYFKQENYGNAALWYRRALIFSPRMPEPRQNLQTLKNRVGLLDFESKGIEKLISRFRENELVSLLTFGVWLSSLSLAAALFTKSLHPWRALLIISSCLFASLAGTSFFALNIYRSRIAVDQRAVITAAGAIAQTSPVPDAKTIIELPPGSEVRIVNNSGPWQYIDIPGELRGWVRTEAVTPLWPPEKVQQRE